MSQRTAYNFMQAAKKFEGRLAIIANLAPTVIYELAAPGVPDEVVEQVISHQIPASLPAIREAKKQQEPAGISEIPQDAGESESRVGSGASPQIASVG